MNEPRLPTGVSHEDFEQFINGTATLETQARQVPNPRRVSRTMTALQATKDYLGNLSVYRFGQNVESNHRAGVTNLTNLK